MLRILATCGLVAICAFAPKDVKLLQHVVFVTKSGEAYKDEAHPELVDHMSAIQQAPATGAADAL
ncbi:MAG TPA: hypothetical protein VHU44_18935 [Acidobacteriaceae bacterium]|jgi:hypothetical protein|nr:hypothetical protein [Acidobacteriaceae bacterium]